MLHAYVGVSPQQSVAGFLVFEITSIPSVLIKLEEVASKLTRYGQGIRTCGQYWGYTICCLQNDNVYN